MVAFSAFMIKRFLFFCGKVINFPHGVNVMHCALPLTDAWWLTSKDAHLSLRSRTNKKYNICKIYGYFLFSFLAQLLSVPLQSIFHTFSEKYVIFSEYLNIRTGVNKTDQATICSKSPPTSTSVQLPFLSLWTQRNVELIPDEGSGLGGKKKKKRASWKITVRLLEGLKASSRRLTQLLSLPLTFSPPSLSHGQIISDCCSWFPVMSTRLRCFSSGTPSVDRHH